MEHQHFRVKNTPATMQKCPNCDRRANGTNVYQCTNFGSFGCLKGTMMGYMGPYSGCFTKKQCSNCGRTGTKNYVGKVAR